ncbi:phosphoribosylpyrophosphate synthetase [Psychroflexus planctonicus]|uniref:Phosphoribosylpyrophosphate synthetase n=1 Tax=Psychroflexus planctonicus TaxID=1526575 RepID=A0ABQ1SF57_9FLAO|nr:phosphoribosylpyrophosphate synthetase [Psychroflexus planctonicus]GGE27080.1 hypothetical protein GCM10010832_04760 [Psychroflexus planctonicus]
MDTNTLSLKIEELKKLGYDSNFSVKDDTIVNLDKKQKLDVEELTVKHFYRFEGMSNPSDLSILYAVETKDGTKGTLVDGYGISSSISKELSKKIQK